MFDAFTSHHLLLLIAGSGLLFLGWLLYDAVVTFVGGVIGLAIGMGISWLGETPLELGPPIPWIVLIVGAILGLIGGIFLFRYLNKMAFFWAGTIIGGWFAWTAFDVGSEALELSTPLLWALKGIVAILIGVMCLMMRKLFVILASAIAGSLLIYEGLGWMAYPGIALVALPIGMILQFKWSKKKRKAV